MKKFMKKKERALLKPVARQSADRHTNKMFFNFFLFGSPNLHPNYSNIQIGKRRKKLNLNIFCLIIIIVAVYFK